MLYAYNVFDLIHVACVEVYLIYGLLNAEAKTQCFIKYVLVGTARRAIGGIAKTAYLNDIFS